MQIIVGLLIGILGFFIYEKFFKGSEKLTGVDKFKKDVQKYSFKVHKNDYVTTYSEGQFFRRLQEYVKDKDVLIFSKVRVGDIIRVDNFPNGKRIFSITGRLDRSHFDFVVVQKSTLKIICVIELDDFTHSTKIAQERDEIKDFICQFVKIPLIRFNKISPTDEDFREKGL